MTDLTATNDKKYKIRVIQTEKSKIPQIQGAKQNILLKHPFSLFVVGKTGSGKTMTILNLINEEWGYKNYFKNIIVFSPTAGTCDDQFKNIVPDDNIISNPSNEFIDMLFDSQKEELTKKSIHKIPRLLLIFDDCQGNKEFEKNLTKIFVKNRHYSISCIYMAQSFKNSLPKSARLQASGVILFPASNSENNVFIEEFCPPRIKKKDFHEMITYCHTEPYNFMFINNQVKTNEKYRHNFDTILKLKD